MIRKPIMIVVSVLLLAVPVGAISYGWASGKTADWWAAWGQWIGGAGSIAAAVAALWIARTGWRHADALAQEGWARAESEHDRQAQRHAAELMERDKALARKVWGAALSPRPPEANSSQARAVRFHIANRGPLPVFHAVITDVKGPGDREMEGFADLTPIEPVTVNAGDSSDEYSPMDLWGARVLSGYVKTARADEYSVTVRFKDSNSLWWQRTDLQDPVPIDANGDPLSAGS